MYFNVLVSLKYNMYDLNTAQNANVMMIDV